MANSCCSRGVLELTDVGSTLLFGGTILSLMDKGGPGPRTADAGADPLVDEDLSWRMDGVTSLDAWGACDRDDDCDDFIANWALDAGLPHIPATRTDLE